MNNENVTEAAKEQLTEVVHEGINLIEIFKDFVEKHGFKVLSGLILLFVGIFLAKKIRRLIQKMMRKSAVDASAISFLSQILYFAMLVIIGINALGIMGFPTSSLVAAVGGFGIALGLALQGNLSNLASGILILIFKPFRVGDFIEAYEASGTVHEIQMMSTILYTLDFKKIIVPNSKLTSENVINFSSSDERRISFIFEIDYESDHRKALALLEEIFQKEEKIMDDPAPLVAIKNFSAQGVQITAVPWVKNEDYWEVYHRVMRQVKEAFDEAGIERPLQKFILPK